MKKLNNIKEFKELILKYESITIEDILRTTIYEKENVLPVIIMQELTGYGTSGSCTLCKTMRDKFDILKCDECVWVRKTGNKCHLGLNIKTYEKFYKIDQPEAIIKACKNRAKYMRLTINWMNILLIH